MNRFSYEFNEDTRLFKFYDSNLLSFFCVLPESIDAMIKAEELIEEVKEFESNR
jgi:hypothetical protein